MKKLSKSIAVCHLITSGRSGSIFLHSLFEGHPEILTIPVLFDSYAFWKQHSHFSVSEICKKLFSTTNFQLLIQKQKTQESGDFSQFKFSADQFSIYFQEMNPQCDKYDDFMFSLYTAYAKTVGIKLDKIRLIFEHAHFYPYWVDQKREWIPHVRFLHTIRNPKASFFSYYKRYSQLNKGYISPEHFLYIFESCIYGIQDILKYKSKVFYRVLRLEDLHQTPEKTLRATCQWMGIPFQDSLMNSTLGGTAFVASSGVHTQTHGFSPNIVVPKYQGSFSHEDLCFIETLTKPLCLKFDYPLETEANMDLERLCLYRFKNEIKINLLAALRYYSYVISSDRLEDTRRRRVGLKWLPKIFTLQLMRLNLLRSNIQDISQYWQRRKQAFKIALSLHDESAKL